MKTVTVKYVVNSARDAQELEYNISTGLYEDSAISVVIKPSTPADVKKVKALRKELKAREAQLQAELDEAEINEAELDDLWLEDEVW